MKKDSKWEKVSFGEGKSQDPICELTFRPNGQIVFNAAMLEKINYAETISLFFNAQDSQIAVKAAAKSDADVISLGATGLQKGQPRTIMAKKVYRWLCGMAKKTEGEVLIKLRGELKDDGMVVFDLKKALIRPKRVRNAESKE